jgi:hypothetical protein
MREPFAQDEEHSMPRCRQPGLHLDSTWIRSKASRAQIVGRGSVCGPGACGLSAQPMLGVVRYQPFDRFWVMGSTGAGQ